MNDIDQSGFVPRRSTQHAIAVAINNINEAEQLVAIDIESAFDSIEPQIHDSTRVQQRIHR